MTLYRDSDDTLICTYVYMAEHLAKIKIFFYSNFDIEDTTHNIPTILDAFTPVICSVSVSTCQHVTSVEQVFIKFDIGEIY
jgi:hypothetical protein